MENNTQDTLQKNLLIIDDEVEIIKSLQRQFRKNHHVFVAGSAREGYEIMRKNEIHVVISDQRMPEMTGVEFFSKIKTEFPDAIRLILTGYSDIEAIIQAINDGHIFRYVAKPWDPEELNSIIHEAFEKYNLLIQNRLLIKELSQAKDTLEHKVLQRTSELTKANEKLAEINAQKDRFFSIIGHDLRGPIGGYKLLLEALIQEFDLTDTEELENILKMLHRGLSSSYELLDNLLSWARNQQGKITFSPQELLLDEVVSNTTELLNEIAGNKQITLKKDYSADTRVFADENMLRAILRNLIGNSIKFSFPGKSIFISATGNEKETILSIRDEGIGISPENQRKLFHLSEHFTTFGTHDEKGSGLGLLLCKDFIERHHGILRVESEPGQGSTFSFSLPGQSSPQGDSD